MPHILLILHYISHTSLASKPLHSYVVKTWVLLEGSVTALLDACIVTVAALVSTLCLDAVWPNCISLLDPLKRKKIKLGGLPTFELDG